jgi:hypothetical protein
MCYLEIKDQSGEVKALSIEGKYCGKECEFKKKMFQGFGGWLGFEVDGCLLFGQLATNKGKCIRCNECLELSKKQIEDHNAHWIKA